MKAFFTDLLKGSLLLLWYMAAFYMAVAALGLQQFNVRDLPELP